MRRIVYAVDCTWASRLDSLVPPAYYDRGSTTIVLRNFYLLFLALAQDGAVAYQITALQSQLPTYGIAYAFGMAMAFKIVGPIFISLKGYKYFARLCRIFFVCAFLFIPLIVGCTVPFSNGLAFDSGANACQYAGSDECVSFFSNVFGDNATGGEYTLPFTYRVFALASSSESIFIIFRAMLLTLDGS